MYLVDIPASALHLMRLIAAARMLYNCFSSSFSGMSIRSILKITGLVPSLQQAIIISKAKIAVPPIEEQRRIVSILDRFDALCNDLTSGLPAEIEARKKQYEYYRDKLLSFQEKQ